MSAAKLTPGPWLDLLQAAEQFLASVNDGNVADLIEYYADIFAEAVANAAGTAHITPWFPADVKPARVGVYERQGSRDTYPFSYWDGKRWLLSGETPEAAARHHDSASYRQNLPWRGLAKDPR